MYYIYSDKKHHSKKSNSNLNRNDDKAIYIIRIGTDPCGQYF